MTPTQKARLLGFKTHLARRGITVRTDTGEAFTVVRNDIPAITDPEQSGKAELPVFVHLVALTSDCLDPRKIGLIVEVNDDGTDGRSYAVIQYLENVVGITCTWLCEASRR